MRRYLAVLFVFISVFILCACGQSQIIEKEVPVEVQVEVPVVPEEYKKYQDVIDALETGNYDTAQALIEALKPIPETPPIVEVKITKDNFFDYFEYVEFPEKEFKKDSSGNITAVESNPCFMLKKEYTTANEKRQECNVNVGVKYKVLRFSGNSKALKVDLEHCTYKVNGKPDYTNTKDETYSGYTVRDSFSIHFDTGYGTYLTNNKNHFSTIVPQENIKLISASGTLYLYEN